MTSQTWHLDNGCGHTKEKAPHPVRSEKLSSFRRGARCPEDELFVAKILELNPNSDELYYLLPNRDIIDARPKVNALANQAGGEGGWESVNVYKSCKILFMGLENIHIIRDSFNKLFILINQLGSQVSWEAEQDGSGWLRHIRAILLAAREVTATIGLGKSVMIHCSDGWDRTALISALAQLSLDPYYRTTRGFQILIEKEWLSFGHKFGDRAGHQEGQKMTSSEKSPVFLQFLDCVSQFLYQFPTSFQFSNSLLVLLADQVYSSRFGTFLCNSDCERMRQSISSRTVSLWTYINANHNQFVNPFYDDKETSTLFISCSPQSILLWSAFYLRHHPPFASSTHTHIPSMMGLCGPRINLDLVSSSLPSTLAMDGEEEEIRKKRAESMRGSAAFLNKPSLNLYSLHLHDTISWSPMAMVEKRAREMAIHIQQLENELNQIRKSQTPRAKGGNFTEFASFLRIPKPSPAINKQAVLEAKHTIELILLKTFEIVAVRQVFKRTRQSNIQIGGRITSPPSHTSSPSHILSPSLTLSPSHPLSSSLILSPSPSPPPRPASPAAPSPPSTPHAQSPHTSPNTPAPPIPPRISSSIYNNLSGNSGGSAFLQVSTMKPPPLPPKNRSSSTDSLLPPHPPPTAPSPTLASTSPSPPPWIRDQYSTCCEMCGKGFTKVWRKHHCRSCGMIFCANCTKRKLSIPSFHYFHPVRVCDNCYLQLTPT